MSKTKKKKREPYFGIAVQEAIIEYNEAEIPTERNIIYRDRIHKALDKLAENVINTFKFPYFDVPFEDVKAEVVAFMVMNMHKYDHTKGSKAFSYFSVVAKNYLILHNNNAYKKLKTHKELTVLDSGKYGIGKTYMHSDSKQYYYEELLRELVVDFEKNVKSMFKKKRDIDVAYAILELLIKRDEIENFNKKNLYIMIREMTGVNTSHITKVMNIFRKHYRSLIKEYETQGIIEKNKLMNKFL